MSLQSLVRWLVPREEYFYDFLEQQTEVACRAADTLRSFREGDPVAAVRDRIQDLEHEGDRIFHAMESALAQTFVTPIDREDLHKLSAELDDIVDRMNGAVRAAVLLGVERPTPPMVQLTDILVSATEQLRAAVPRLRKHQYAEMRESILALRKLEKDADAVFRRAVSELFRDPAVDAKQLLREREILDDLENAVDHCDRVAGTLANLAVKHG
jgi:predicted phosphate transport protein (TIGR00153 family)